MKSEKNDSNKKKRRTCTSNLNEAKHLSAAHGMQWFFLSPERRTTSRDFHSDVDWDTPIRLGFCNSHSLSFSFFVYTAVNRFWHVMWMILQELQYNEILSVTAVFSRVLWSSPSKNHLESKACLDAFRERKVRQGRHGLGLESSPGPKDV